VRATWITGTSNSYSHNQLDHGDNRLGIRVGYVDTPLVVLHHVYFGVLERSLFPCLGELGACRVAEATRCTAVEGDVDREAAEEEGEGLAHCLARWGGKWGGRKEQRMMGGGGWADDDGIETLTLHRGFC